MNISKSLQEKLIKQMRVQNGETLMQPEEDLSALNLSVDLQRSLSRAQELLDSNATLVDARKAVNASIGKTRKKGENADALIQQSRQLSETLNAADCEIELLLKKIVDAWDPSNARKNTTYDISALSTPLPAVATHTDHAVKPISSPDQFGPYAASTASVNVDTVSIRDDIGAVAWNAYVSSNIHATHYHQYEWNQLLKENFRQRTYYIAAVDGADNIVGMTTAVFMKSFVVDSVVLSTPFLIYGGPIADTPEISALLADHLVSIAAANGCTSTQIRELRPRDGWACNLEKVAMVLGLPADIATLNQGFGSKLRSQVKRATRERPTLQIGGSELIDDFYCVFSRKMRDHGTPVYSRRFFKDIVDAFPDSTHLAVVQLHGRPVAAAFLIRYRKTVEVPWAASMRKSDKLGMNMFMYHGLLEDAVNRGYRFFDFGRSTKGCETWRFKKQWGAKEQQLYWHTHTTQPDDEPAGDAKTESSGSLIQLAVDAWKHLPVPIANRIGPLLARQLPW